MKTSPGFDRMSTEEELHQVLAVLGDLTHGTWTFPGEDEMDAQVVILSAGPLPDDFSERASVAQIFINRPERKN